MIEGTEIAGLFRAAALRFAAMNEVRERLEIRERYIRIELPVPCGIEFGEGRTPSADPLRM